MGARTWMARRAVFIYREDLDSWIQTRVDEPEHLIPWRRVRPNTPPLIKLQGDSRVKLEDLAGQWENSLKNKLYVDGSICCLDGKENFYLEETPTHITLSVMNDTWYLRRDSQDM